jgi:hypothetical protein
MSNSINDGYVSKVYTMTKNYSEIQDNYLKKYAEYRPHYDKTNVQAGTMGNTFNEFKLSDNRVNNANTLSNSPSLMDGYQKDINELMIQQNTVYIISSIAVSSLLVLAILVGRT